MKTKTLFLILLILSLLLSACGNTASASQAQTTNANGTPQPGGAFGTGELSVATKLALGTLKLEGTEQAITTEQAVELVTLWQGYQALSNSETAATVELDAVIKQIQSAMTPEQTQAIEAMNLTRDSMAETMQSLGLDFGGRSGTNAEGTPVAGSAANGEGGMTPPDGAPSGGNGANRGSGGMGPGGGMPPGGGMGPGGDAGGMGLGPDTQTTPDASTQATMQARMQAQANRVNPMILQALIAMLESK
jgi:hypothetical protein